MKFNKQQIKKLSVLEKVFDAAVHQNYKKPTCQLQNNLCQSVYEEASGVKENVRWSCATCAYNYYKKVGEVYFQSLTELEKDDTTTTTKKPKTTNKQNGKTKSTKKTP